ncbi:MAG: FAD:protein FMN transferase [Nitrosomonas sp.]|nr:FAD:protein FMN transferase [Nitrosomonas sp.]
MSALKKSLFPHRLLIALLVIFTVTSLLMSWLLFTPSLRLSLEHLQGQTMGTQYSIKFRHPRISGIAESMREKIESVLAQINRSMSTYDPASEISRLNQRHTTDWIPVSAELLTVLDAALEIGRKSEGAFDITIGPLVNLWGFGSEFRSGQIPDEESINRLRRQTGHDKLRLDRINGTVRKLDPDIHLDLSAIAKGYAVDQIAQLFTSAGIEHYMIEIGGEIRAKGSNTEESAWRIGIEKPQQHTETVHKILSIEDMALATSGDYRNFFEFNGKHYSHLINPVTGWPIQSYLVSVTVLAQQCMQADAWATALVVLGHERGLKIAEKWELPVLYLVNQNGNIKEFASSYYLPERQNNHMRIFVATFLIMGLAILAMAIGVLNKRSPLTGSCGGLGRLGAACDAGCARPCANKYRSEPQPATKKQN